MSQGEFRDNREKEKAQRGLLGHRGPKGLSRGAELLGQAPYKGRKNEGAEYSLGRVGIGVALPDFHPSSTFLRGGGSFVLI